MTSATQPQCRQGGPCMESSSLSSWPTPRGCCEDAASGVCVWTVGSASIRGKQGQRKGRGSHPAARVLAYNSQPPLGLPRGLPGVVIRSLRKGRRRQLIQGHCRTTAPSNPRASKEGKACRELWFRAPRGAKGEPVKGRPSRSQPRSPQGPPHLRNPGRRSHGEGSGGGSGSGDPFTSSPARPGLTVTPRV